MPRLSVRSTREQLLPGLTEAQLAVLVRAPFWLVVVLDHRGRVPHQYGPELLVTTFLQHLTPIFHEQALATEAEFPAILITARLNTAQVVDAELDAAIGPLLRSFGSGRRNWIAQELSNGELNGHLIREQATFDKVIQFLKTIGVERLPDQPPAPALPPVLETLRALEEELARLQVPIVERFHQFLKQIEGTAPETYEQAVETIDAIKRFARLAGRQLLCRGQPITLQCTRAKRAKRASIQARCFADGNRRVISTGISIPPLSSRPTA